MVQVGKMELVVEMVRRVLPQVVVQVEPMAQAVQVRKVVQVVRREKMVQVDKMELVV